jgi:hypothetical protein
MYQLIHIQAVDPAPFTDLLEDWICDIVDML